MKRNYKFVLCFGLLWSIFLYFHASIIFGNINDETLPKCKNVFIDAGANRGDNIGAFVNETDGEMTPMMEWILMNTSLSVADYCIFAFEGNPSFTEQLKEKEIHYRHLVKHIKIFTETIVSSRSGLQSFYLEPNKMKHSYGSTTQYRKNHQKIQLPVIDLDQFIRQRILDGMEVLVLKMDVEGEEYKIIDELLEHRTLCSIPNVFLGFEWHNYPSQIPEEYLNSAISFRTYAETRLHKPPCNVKKFFLNLWGKGPT